jgi:phosphate transport system protein
VRTLTEHTDKAYEAELRTVRERLLEMGGMVEQAISSSVRAITERDSELADRVKERDREIDRMEVEVDRLCRRILALHQPAASDLRFITTALKIVVDLERVGDLAVNVAERALDLNHAPPLGPAHELAKIAELVEAQLKKALDAFVAGAVEKSEDVIRDDDLVDALYLQFFNQTLARMMEDSRTIRRATATLFAAKHLERCADHAVNLAEMVVYMVRGTDVRHPDNRRPHEVPP